MKKYALLVVLGGAILLIAQCSFPVGEDYRNFIAPADTVVVDYNLRTYVPIPVKDESPVKTLTSRRDLDASVTWKKGVRFDPVGDSENFELGVQYTAEISLETKNGYVFDPGKPFEYADGMVEDYPVEDNLDLESRTITVTYKSITELALVEEVDLTTHISKPSVSILPSPNFNAEEYAGYVSWERLNGTRWEPISENFFRIDSTYRAVVKLEAKPNFIFEEVEVMHSKSSSSGSSPNPPDPLAPLVSVNPGEPKRTEVIATLDFGKLPTEYISDYDLASYIPLPITGQMPPRGLLHSRGMSVSANWEREDGVNGNNEPNWVPFKEGVFQLDGYYKAKITLEADTGYAFANGQAGHPKEDFSYGTDGTGADVAETEKQNTRNDAFTREVTVTYFPSLIRYSVTGTETFESEGIAAINEHKDKAGVIVRLPADPQIFSGLPADLTTLSAPPIVIIEGQGATTILRKTNTGNLMSVDETTVTLRNMVLAGNAANTAPLLSIRTGGTVILEGVTVKDNTNTSGQGGGVRVDNGGKLIMKAGSRLTGNTSAGGAGVYVGGSFEMHDDAKITGHAGGSVVYIGGTFTMYGGSIESNGSGSVPISASIIDNQGTFDMRGGSIKNNYANQGVSVRESNTFTMSGGSIEGNTFSGAVQMALYGAFTMLGGSIKGNTGSGVVVPRDTYFIMSGGSIENNSLYGVSLDSSGGFTMSRGARIPPGAGNGVNLNGASISIVGNLTGTAPVANIILNGQTTGAILLSGYLTGNTGKFRVGGLSDKIDAAGQLK
ncbi:MAG: right-handed parallel beta-helix repeat-containing protein [Treponema sp.]|jgi:hypothetical protein|nr:right-handed parallel beta-helix repeat-containing protein [Treponema sp.]